MKDQFSDERLNAFVDGELDAPEREEILGAITTDTALGHRLCELRATKDLVRHAYDFSTVRTKARTRRTLGWNGALAAGIALVIGIVVGWKGHRAASGAETGSPLAWAHNLFAEQPARILIHLDNAALDHMEETLDIAETYLAKYDHANVEVVVNNSGINLLREETSPYAARIAALSSRHELLSFVACGYAISRYRKAGQTVTLLPNAKVASSAIEHVVERVREGWTYVKI